MKRDVSINHFTGPATKATIVIDKNGLSVINKSEYCSDSSVCKGFISQLLNMDQWQHTWHMDVSRVAVKCSDERKRARQIMLDKIEQREKEIQALKDGIQVLGRFNLSID